MTEQELLDITKRELDERRPLLYSMTEVVIVVDGQAMLKTIDGFSGSADVQDAIDRSSASDEALRRELVSQQVRMWLEQFEHEYATWRVNRAKRELIESLPKPRPESMGDAPLQGFRLGQPTPRAPCCGDILLNPQRWVIQVDRLAKTFTTEPLDESPEDMAGGAHNLPVRNRGKGWSRAPIDPSYTETRLSEQSV